ncbi:MAG TPA: alpha/beta hydrolase [Rhizomicrobium sp.]|nr:alpha/beta hydrolase [Rhizomicrobium sp.]
MKAATAAAAFLMLLPAGARAQTPVADSSQHKIQFVTVDKDVKLEVLDWGGKGPPLVFMAGLGNTAHGFDGFAEKFTGTHHVYGITRRGFGDSSKPAPTPENYGPDRLGDDVLAVIDALTLQKPVLAGHSIAGQELTSIGTRHPEKVAGLIYLEAGYEYSFFNAKFADGSTRYGVVVDMDVLRHDLQHLSSTPPAEARALIGEIQQIMPRLQKTLRWYAPQDEVADRAARPQMWPYVDAVEGAQRRYTVGPKLPMLALFAVPQDCGKCDDPNQKIWDAAGVVAANAFEAGNPGARVVRIAHARHGIWKSNEADVLREMNAFLGRLPQ